MKKKGRLQFLRYNGVWVDSAMKPNLDHYVKEWLMEAQLGARLIADYSYRWVEGGVAVYLPRNR